MPARAAGLVEETDEPTRLVDIRVFPFDGLLLVIDLDRITDENIVELATSAALDTVLIHRVANASSKPQAMAIRSNCRVLQTLDFTLVIERLVRQHRICS
ncbi:hypothetical protein ACFFQF_22160 [Haladaptatus pallidirubidus]|uniref:hypothetical protein n=1 Tax=Haladaptatus pallidirubidus TaxID=1008152 RepID=UPI0035EEAB94